MIKNQTNSPPTGGIYAWRVETLIKKAIEARDHNAGWRYIVALHRRGTKDVLDVATALCHSKKAKDRAIGADVLGQLGIPERTFPEKALKVLRDMLRVEQDAIVLSSILIAIGHSQDSDDKSGLDLIIEKKGHENEDVRFGVVYALLGRSDRVSISALVELSTDRDNHVRDWATFGLGSQIDVNNKAIREALWNRVSDSDLNTKSEGIVGLAKRHDKRIRPVLLEQLNDEAPRSMIFEAAAEFGDRIFLPHLRAIRKKAAAEKGIDEWWLRSLNDAIKKLQKKTVSNNKFQRVFTANQKRATDKHR